MRQKGISFRLNFYITSIAIFLITSVVFINYHLTNKVLIQKINEGAINQSNLVISKIAQITVSTQEVARNIASQALHFYKDNQVDYLIDQVKNTNPVIENIRIVIYDRAKNDFNFYSTRKNSPSTNFYKDSVDTQLFINKYQENQAREKTGEWFSAFYSNPDSSDLLVSYKIPIYAPARNEIIGLVSCDISLSVIREILGKLKIGESGYAFVIDQNQNFITHPKREWILNRNMKLDSFKLFKEKSGEFEKKISNRQSGAIEGTSEYLGGKKAWYYFAPLPNSGWYAVIVLPDEELFRDIHAIYIKIIAVSIGGILLLFVLNLFIFKLTLEPLIRITYAIKSFTSPGKGKDTTDEIKMLVESLEDWRTKYGLMVSNQTKIASEKKKIEKDLLTAKEIQQNIIPEGNPDFADHPEIDLFAALKPAEIIGGDLYDYFFIGKNHLLIAIGDVSGKGIPASLFMAITSTLIKSNAKILSAKDIVARVNKELCARNSNQYFVALFLGILDIRHGILDYCNAAHNFPYVLHSNGSLEILSKSHGLPLGIYGDKTYRNSTADLRNGDTLVLYTDGVINAMDKNNQLYGTEKLELNIRNRVGLSARELVTELTQSVDNYEEGSSQSDDISLMAIRYMKE